MSVRIGAQFVPMGMPIFPLENLSGEDHDQIVSVGRNM